MHEICLLSARDVTKLRSAVFSTSVADHLPDLCIFLLLFFSSRREFFCLLVFPRSWLRIDCPAIDISAAVKKKIPPRLCLIWFFCMHACIDFVWCRFTRRCLHATLKLVGGAASTRRILRFILFDL